MYKYAQLDDRKIVVGISELSGEVEKHDMILLNAETNINIGWQLKDGEWIEPLPQEPELQEPDINEILQAEMLLNQAEVIDRLNTVEMGNAAILLMLAEGGMM